MDAPWLFEALCHYASREVGDKLFGQGVPLACEAFRRSMVGRSMPVLWFEVPLLGPARFDLHVAHDNDALHAEAPFGRDAADGHGELLNWYASAPRGGGGLALAYDVGDGRIGDPAVHVNVNGAAGAFDAEGFFAHVGRPDAATLYDGFVARLPVGWRVWYFGVHPGRPGTPVRVDCFVDTGLKRAYASDSALLGEHLRRVGIGALGADAHGIVDAVTDSPFRLELQFDVLADGRVGPTLGVSAGFGVAPVSVVRGAWAEGGDVARMMRAAERMGVCDARWALVPQALFARRLPRGAGTLALYCLPVFVKFRLRAGRPLDAKVYLQAGARSL